MHLPLADRVRSFIRSEAVLVIAAFAAILSALAFPPTAQNLGAYADAIDTRRALAYGALFALALACVGRLVSWEICSALTICACLAIDRDVLRHIDYSLLLTFICFFIFVGNLKHIDAIATTLASLVSGREIIVSALVSQVISNVPAAIMLSGFTDDAVGLLIGTNIGGLGTPVASLASLITLRIYGRSHGARTVRYLCWFTAINMLLLTAFLALATLLAV